MMASRRKVKEVFFKQINKIIVRCPIRAIIEQAFFLFMIVIL